MKRHLSIFNGMFKKAAGVLLALLLCAFAMPIGCGDGGTHEGGEQEPPIPEGGVRVTVNYYRPDNTYADWDMWIWGSGSEGAGYAFSGTTTANGLTWSTAIADISKYEPDADGNAVGFIVRKGGSSWSDKDIADDRFIPVSKITDSKVTIYLISGIADVYYSAEEALAGMEELNKKKIDVARFSAFDELYIHVSDVITAKSVFKLKDNIGNTIASYDCSDSENASTVGRSSLTVKIPSEISLSKDYTVVDEPAIFDDEYNFAERAVSKYSLFNTARFDELYGYTGTLGAEYSAAQTKFTVWSPYATAMKLNIYAAGEGGTATSYDMTAGEKGTWAYTLTGDQNGKYYTYTVINGTAKDEVVDPYARSGGKNGKRGMILDLDKTDPTGWATQSNPMLGSNAEAVIWEAQLRDVTIHESSNVTAANRGKFLGLTESAATNGGKSTPLDYLKELGITQVHFQPLFDFASVDESFKTATYNKDGEYNWGYDPLNYNMPEGSYSSDPADGTKRVNEMKQMIMALHNAGIQVVMDVVYNHVSNAQSSNFEKLMPGYYFRMTNEGGFYNGSGCGNETASDHSMFRKFMIDSVLYWTQEYNIDGFRFDLMALHDIDTMNAIYDELKKVNPDVIVYGEGWTGGTSGLSTSKQALLANAKKMPNIAFFNDSVRDGLKGSVFDMLETGFISGKAKSDNAVYVGAKGGIDKFASPLQNINYTACHDNSLLWDKLNASVEDTKANIMAMNRLAATAIFTGQGISFIPAGEELMRSKPTTKTNNYDNRPNVYKTDENYYFADNSYKSPDSVNAIDWSLLDNDDNKAMLAFYKELIAIKKTFKQFRLTTAEQVGECVIADVDTAADDGVAVFAVKDPESDEYVIVILNNGKEAKTVTLPNGAYGVYVNGDKAKVAEPLSAFEGSSVEVGAYSAVVVKATLTSAAVSAWTYGVA